MCGIAGVFSFEPGSSIQSDTISRLLAPMGHRGPDEAGQLCDGAVGVGMCRLSIIDVEGGHQPVYNEDGSVAAVLNGEIYNYLEIRQELISKGHTFRTASDTEVIVHLYEDLGDRFPEKLNGMFAIAVFDRRLRRLLLVRDRVGEKPLFVYQDAKRFMFASEIKAILASSVVERAVDPAALRHYLALNYVPAPLTMFRGIRQLLPATVVSIEPGRISERIYWKLPLEPEIARDERQTREEIRELFYDSVRLRLRADVPVGVFLSGGIDSSAVTCASRTGNATLNTFSISFPGEAFDEGPAARRVAQQFATAHHEVVGDPALMIDLPRVVWHCDQPHGDASFLPLYQLSAHARRRVKVVLGGEGADELFGGYEWHGAQPAEGEEHLTRMLVFDSRAQQRLLCPDLWDASPEDPLERFRAAHASASRLDATNRLLFLDFTFLLPGNNLVKSDRMGMAHSIELRSPFLDHRLVELAFSIPGHQKIGAGLNKRCLREAFAEVLPAEVRYRPKQMFRVPMTAWLRTGARAAVEQLLLDNRRDIVDNDYVQHLLAEHATGTRDHTRKIRSLVALEVWFRTFIDDFKTGRDDLDLGIEWKQLATGHSQARN